MNALKEALLRTLREEYGITTEEQLLTAVSHMDRLDISQFVVHPSQDITKR